MIMNTLLLHVSRTVWLTVIVLLFAFCGSDENQISQPVIFDMGEVFVESNKYLIKLEEEAIDDFIERYGWEMNKTGTGLRYMIHDEGKGKFASYGDRAIINYNIYLITGDLVYSSDHFGPKSFTVGRGGVQSGLEEGILLMREGAKATMIMPFYLAYGVPGDGNKIPGRASIVYQIELVELN